MDTTRRNFLIGVGAGLILPTFYEAACKHLLANDSPLILPPSKPTIELLAHDYAGNGSFTLNWGDPYSELPDFMGVSWRDFADEYMDGDYEWVLLANEDDDAFDLDDTVNPYWAEDHWILKHSPNGRAYDLLSGYDLGLDHQGAQDAGQIHFIEGDRPGSDYRGVEADAVGLSLLQHNLNELNTSISLSVYA